ncbi:L-ribulose-5-phosphate 4-epimerase AraD [Candidatus Parcubacteria bacterium]|nr:L-ribulose-5-phosphate 4-epimerase AraD [Candidatus Parcubacteria bacterium]
MFAALKKIVCEQNRRLPAEGLVILTEGNVSQLTPDRKYMAIKPSGVEYPELTPAKIVIVDMTGRVVEGQLRPSTDTLTHLEIYRRFRRVTGVAHTHSAFATTFAQMAKPIPCYGTTHADAFFGHVPVTRSLRAKEIQLAYEVSTGRVIAEILELRYTPAVLVAKHGPFAFGVSAKEAVDQACILEKVAMMAILGRPNAPVSAALLKKHWERKHGAGSYYGQSRREA